jgi:predicted dehydrogenase/threonine dehydrogenase-like Zn-dependent dehydrogenase
LQQIFQDIKTGETVLSEVPVPQVCSGQLLIRTQRSLISAGTERMLVDFGRASLIDKARQQPDKVRMVLDKIRTDGLMATIDAVRSKLDQPLPLGYCNAGIVLEVGTAVTEFSVGDRVVSNGPHAGVVCVPANLCARIPDGVADDVAAFTVLAAIGLQGIRLAQPTLGEVVVVTGLGLIGLVTVQMLRANGCRVIGIDFDAKRLELARQFGADTVNPAAGEDPIAGALTLSGGGGVDAVIITASTNSSEPVSQAAQMCRQRGRIVLVGVTGLELNRADFYKKELSFQVSCSYGPGRYDANYEEKGQDYPVGFVRWTEQRNFQAVLDLMASGRLDANPLISHRFPLQQAAKAYELLSSGQPSLGIVLEYPQIGREQLEQHTVPVPGNAVAAGKASVAFVGAGNYASRVLIPAFKEAGAGLHTVVSSGGVSAVHHGRKHGFATVSTYAVTAITEPAVDTVVIATRHDSHARYVVQALRAGKHVFCEKPLCLTLDELSQIEAEAKARPGQALMVGFNRRFAPQVMRMKQLLATASGPKSFIMTVNAGEIPGESWVQDPTIGGGRIVGEACHFIDLLRHLSGNPIIQWQAVALGRHSSIAVTSDKATITLRFADGSVGVILYLANGHKGYPKERLEVFCAGRVLQLDNFRALRAWGWPGFERMRLWRQDKGQRACARAFVNAVRQGTASPIALDEIIDVSRVSIEVQRVLT